MASEAKLLKLIDLLLSYFVSSWVFQAPFYKRATPPSGEFHAEIVSHESEPFWKWHFQLDGSPQLTPCTTEPAVPHKHGYQPGRYTL